MDWRRKSIETDMDYGSDAVSITMRYVTDEVVPEIIGGENGFRMYSSEEDVLVRSEELNDEILPRIVTGIKGNAVSSLKGRPVPNIIFNFR
jgi:hypothetical protein